MQKNKNDFIHQLWDGSIIETLIEYIKIPNKSPHFDPKWLEQGYMDQAFTLIADWCQKNAVPEMKMEIVRLGDRTPVLFIEIPGNKTDDTILLYGHLDKQPEMSNWDEDLGPWKPVLRGDRLYGRGSADDGYAIFASLAAIQSLHKKEIPHARCVILIESCEESGSFDLPFYVDFLKDRIGNPSLVICLDSGCGNYDQLWLTTSLRGLVSGTLSIEVLKQGVHSGVGSGIVPSCFRILRMLLDRIENENTGDILLKELFVDIPEKRREQAEQAANILGESIYNNLGFLKDVKPQTYSLQDLLLNRTWKPALSVIGCDGIPAIANAGNVTLPSSAFKLSMRIPPTCDPLKAAEALKTTLEADPPYDAHVHFALNDIGPGWNAPDEKLWLVTSANRASLNHFGKEAAYMGEGGSIPFMGMLGKQFPQAQFIITGVLGPESNAHGPNEFLHIPTGKKLTACVAQIIEDHYHRVLD